MRDDYNSKWEIVGTEGKRSSIISDKTELWKMIECMEKGIGYEMVKPDEKVTILRNKNRINIIQ